MQKVACRTFGCLLQLTAQSCRSKSSQPTLNHRRTPSSKFQVNSQSLSGAIVHSGAFLIYPMYQHKRPCTLCQTMANRVLARQPYSRFFASLSDFQDSAKQCSVCYMIMSTLRERDTLLFDQASNIESGSGPAYHSDGGTDIEGSSAKKSSITLKADLVLRAPYRAVKGENDTYLELIAVFRFARKRRVFKGDTKKWIRASLLALRQKGTRTQ